MPDPDRLLQTLRRASQCYRNTAGRRGRFVELRDLDEVLVAGDMHGNLENFRRLLAKAQLAKYPRRHLVLQEVIHGPFTYPDGSDRSHQLFDIVAALKCEYPARVHLLPGNHEVGQFTERKVIKHDRDLNTLFLGGVQQAYGGRSGDVLAGYRELFLTLPFALKTPNRVFLSHSLPAKSRLGTFDVEMLYRTQVPEDEYHPGGSLYALCWGRDTEIAHVEEFLRMVDADYLISGHIPCEGHQIPNDRQLILDSLGVPAACCLFPANRPITFKELCAGVEVF